MTTTGALIDRLYRRYLEPPDAQPASTRLVNTITDVETDITLTSFQIPEDENLLRIGSILELESELVEVNGFDATTRVASVLRGQLGTEAVAHNLGIQIKLSPPFPRIEAFDAIGSNIIGLYPDLWTVRTAVLGNVGLDVYPIQDPLAVEIVEANPDGWPRTLQLDGRIVDNHPNVDGRAIVTNGGQLWSTVWFRYRRRFEYPTDEATTLEDLGLDQSWENLVLIGAAADLMAGRDITASMTDWVQATLETENIRVGTRMSIAGGLAQYRDILMGRFKREMRGEDSNRVRVHMNDPMVKL